MNSLPDAELLVRVRAKPEVDPEIVRALVPDAPNVAIVDTAQNFLEQLAGCDLLVCHFSTTAEQALQMGKPVLLWGSTRRYCQFPALREAPASGRRAAVYAVDTANRLPQMLAAIRDQHHGRPLSEQETARYRNRPEDPDLRGLATRLLSGT